MKKGYDVTVIGAGPAGLYSAYRLMLNTDNKLKIAIIEKGKALNKRVCPSIKNKTSCLKCKVCSIMSGVGGAGSFSDGKYPITNDFGGTLWEKIGKENALDYMKTVDLYNHDFYKEAFNIHCIADDDYPKIYISEKSIYKKICTQHNMHLMDASIRHLGTDYSQAIYNQLYRNLINRGVDFYVDTEADVVEQQSTLNYVVTTKQGDEFQSKYLIIAGGRTGNKWVNKICKKLSIPTLSNRVDIGIRFECPNEVFEHITSTLYESKIIYKSKTYEDDVRTFCMNPSGSVVAENTDCGITVNGHSYEDPELKTENTNFALLVSKTFTEPFNNSNEYGEAIIRLSNMLGGGVIIQRYGDLIRGKRSTKQHIKNNTVRPTLNAEPGDLSLVLPKRILDDIVEMISALDHIAPGMTNDDNLLYGVECKFYNSLVKTNTDFQPDKYKNLFFLGDSSGVSHSLSQASAMGLAAADIISKDFGK